MASKKGGKDMSPTTLNKTRKKTYLSDSRAIIQKAIKEKGLTKEEIVKSFTNDK
ncbi:hypothetical protein [Paenibacillus sp. USHLN196]|uniref:hypothetical protein n=1 Tax=Paenibacillus sp. USHLN196 TaxID=3081291 RepID=UPI0030166E4E